MACLDYGKVWEVMNDLDEVVQRTKIISDMCDSLRKTIYDWTDADEVIDEVDALRGFSKYIIRELESSSITAWNNTVVPLNPNKPSLRVGGDLDALDVPEDLVISTGNTDTFNVEGVDFAGIGTDTFNISLNTDEVTTSNYGYRLDELQE